MAKLKMKKIELIALLTDSKKIIELLQRRGVVEICQNEEELSGTNVTSIISEFEKFRSTAAQALDILEIYAPEKTGISQMIGGRTEVEKHAFGREAMQIDKIMNAAAEIIRSSKTISESEAQIAQNTIKCDTLEHWTKLDVPLDFKGTATTVPFIGSLPYMASAETVEAELPDGSFCEIINASKEQTNIFVLSSRTVQNETSEALRKMLFIPVSEPESKTPSELIEMYTQENEALRKQAAECENKIVSYQEEREQLKFAVDYLQMRKDKYDVLSSLGFTETTFVLNGYIPEKYCESLRKEIEARYTVYIEYSDPSEDDDVPVLLENSSFSSPVEGITKMYAMPDKKDVDPTPVMSFFYYLFFGMMLSDAGYGLVMVIGTTIALRRIKLEESLKKTLLMFRNCGISTLIWGALFGSWFGDIIQVIGKEFCGREIGSTALWFEPANDPIKLLLFAFGLGIIHLFTGVAVSFKMSWDDGRKLDAILDTLPIYMIILGVAPVGAAIFTEVPAVLKSVGIPLMAAGAALLLLTSGRSSKSIFGKFFGGLYALYNTATGWLSDILSYSRLLALGLATGSIASVINLIGTMPENIIFKAVLLTVVFVLGHTVNMAINLLGAYVHTDRLQFVELFSKFYSGGGREFQPLTVNTKYIKFKEEKINE